MTKILQQLLDYINSSYKYTEALQVFGESMEPDIKDSSLIFIDKKDKTPQKSFIYAVNTQDGFMVKKVGSHGLESINKDIHTDIKEYDVIGRVKGVFIKL